MTSDRRGTARDIRSHDWVDRFVPVAARPYLRLARIDRPTGIWLLMFPCWWSTALATPGVPDASTLALFAIGAAIMRAAGCTLNDILDRDIDAKVARTRWRPIPSGEIGVKDALLFAVWLCLAGLLVLIQFNAFTVALASVSLLLVSTYPLAKRVTYWPQAVLGMTFNWGALVGWASVWGSLDWPAVVLYGGAVFWTLGYDTIYALQDKDDDVAAGVKSTALKFGAHTRSWLWVFYGLAVTLFALAGALANLAWPYSLLLAGVALHFAWQIAQLDPDNAADCLRTFKSNQSIGLWLFLAIVLGQVAR